MTTGGEGEVLKRDGEPDVIEVDEIPFAAMTPVIVTHRFFGRSIADLVMDIQRIKTALLRALLDNAYLANNPRTEVPESHATETTLDDLLVSRPGGIVRTKLPGGLSVIAHPDVGGHVFPLLQYQDATREWRTGVSRQGQGVDPNALQNQVATIANQMFNAAQAKMKMIARIFAETGIRDLFALLHAVVRKHGSQPQTARLRNQWITVDPRDWKARNDMTINVGLGTGTKTEQLAHLNMVIGAQEKAIAAGLVSPKNLYNSARELTKLAGHKNVGLFFTPPGTPPDPNDPASAPIQPPSDPKAQEAQQRIELEKAKAAADGQLSAPEASGRPADERGQDRGRYAIQARAAQDRIRSQGAADERGIRAAARADGGRDGVEARADAARRAGQARPRQCECANPLEYSRCEQRPRRSADRRRAHGRRNRIMTKSDGPRVKPAGDAGEWVKAEP